MVLVRVNQDRGLDNENRYVGLNLVVHTILIEQKERCGIVSVIKSSHSPKESEGQVWGISQAIRLMDKILHDPKDPKLWELWYIPYNG